MSKTWNIVSWNVNGLRAAEKKGFLPWLHQEKHTVVGLQEVRALDTDLSQDLRQPKGYETHFTAAKKLGYSGTAIYSRAKVLSVDTSLGQAAYDDEGRFTGAEYPDFHVYSVYFPKGSGTERDNSRVPYKLGFFEEFFKHALRRRKKTGKPLIIMGDFNTAHAPIDLKNWKTNQTTSGFLPEEREDLTRLLKLGFVDTFRHLNPTKEQYSWWSQRLGARGRNVGWRIDYVWVTPDLLPNVTKAFIHDQVMGSDHCPVGITLKM